jgi:hypothetical protein
MNPPFKKERLEEFYLKEKMSVSEIATYYACSANKVDYWIKKFNIPKRTISEATYLKQNPNGDPFYFKNPRTTQEWFLFGLGLGLYWGEGTKKNKHAVRLGNTDPHLIKKFIQFLDCIYNVEEHKIRFSLQIFSDMKPQNAMQFWCSFLQVKQERFIKTVITPARGIGSYREKTKHGVLTIYVSNKKLRDLLNAEIESLRKMR